eukprot:scaffold20367_cov61-Phaeocystis_antarctica.AAC.1
MTTPIAATVPIVMPTPTSGDTGRRTQMAWTRRPSSQDGRAGPQNWRHRTRPPTCSPSSQRGGRRSRRAAAWGRGRRENPPCRALRPRSSGWHHTRPRRSPGRAARPVAMREGRAVAARVAVTARAAAVRAAAVWAVAAARVAAVW